MESKINSSVPRVIAIIEIFIMFLLGIMGDKISQLLDIEPAALIIFTGIGLIAAVLITTINVSGFRKREVKSNVQPEVYSETQEKRKFYSSKFIPKSMAGVFPLGILAGFLTGVVSVFIDNHFYFNVNIPFWDSFAFTSPLRDHEAFGIYIGFITSLLIALWLDGYLGAAFSIGFGIAFSSTIIQIANHIPADTYFGHILGFTIWAVLLVFLEPILEKISPFLKKLIKKIYDATTQPRI